MESIPFRSQLYTLYSPWNKRKKSPMPLLKKLQIPTQSLAEALPFAKSCEMLWWAVCFHPQRIPLKNSAAQLQNLYSKPLESWIFLKDTTTFTLPEPCSPPAAGSMARGAWGWSPQKPSRAWKETPNPQFPWCTCVFLFKLIPLLTISQAKVRKNL